MRFKFQDELNILSNHFGSIQETADALLVSDPDVIERAIVGASLGSQELKELNNALVDFFDDDVLQGLFDFNLNNDFDEKVKELNFLLGCVESIFGEDRTQFDHDTIRLALAEGAIDADLLLGDAITIFGDLTSNQADRMFDFLADNPNQWNIALQHYINDGAGIFDYDDSDFWEWFRSEIYGD